jgi:transposase
MLPEKKPEQSPKITRQELYDIYDSGRENTVNFMQMLLYKIEKHETMIRELQEQIRHLQDIFVKDSHNSSKPPSTDNPYKKIKSLRTKSGKKPGGQKGHEGHTLPLSDNPDTRELIKVEKCVKCNHSLKDISIQNYERRQVIDLPEIKPIIIEYAAEIADCPYCLHENRGTFPAGVKAPVQYGNNLKSIVSYLTNYGLIPNSRCAEIINEVFHLSLSTGTIVNMNNHYAEALRRTDFEETVKQKLKDSKVIHADETGININKESNWLHVCGSELYTYYFVHAKRGSEAMDEMGILDGFAGTVVHDHWKSYFKYECNHALCNSHHLRELIFIEEEYEQPWATKMKKVLLEIKEAVDFAKRKNRKTLNPELKERFERKYRRIMSQGFNANPPPERIGKKRGAVKRTKPLNMLIRLKHKMKETLRFMYDFKIPFDNNSGERDIRMVKLHQKISGLFRTFRGAQNFCLIRSYISTMKKQGYSIFMAMRMILEGRLPDLMLCM